MFESLSVDEEEQRERKETLYRFIPQQDKNQARM